MGSAFGKGMHVSAFTELLDSLRPQSPRWAARGIGMKRMYEQSIGSAFIEDVHGAAFTQLLDSLRLQSFRWA